MRYGDPTRPMLPQAYRVLRKRRDTADTFTLDLAIDKGAAAAPSFAPGQFNMVYVFGAGEVPISISGDPGDGGRLTHTVRAVGTVTRALDRVKRGGSVGLRGPYGRGWPLEDTRGRDVVILAGGIGLAPLRPLLYRLLADRKAVRGITLLYGARTPDDLLYTRELRTWGARTDLDVRVTVDSARGDWSGRVGVVTTLLERARFDPAGAIAMICGPEIMMRFAAHDLRARGVPADRIHVSLERNMKCAIGLCGHCQYGADFVCKDGPVFRFDQIESRLAVREI